MRKKVALSIAAAAMVGTLAVGGTLAWFTDTETATNVVTVGNVDIKLSESGEGDGIIGEDGLTYTDIMPGREYGKNVVIDNVGNKAYVRAILTVSSEDTNVIAEFVKQEGFVINGLDGSVTWEKAPDSKSATCTIKYDGVFEEDAQWKVFEGFTIPSSWGNAFENAEFTIKVDAQAIQADNIEESQAWDEFAEAEQGANKATDETGAVTESAAEVL